MYCPRHLRFVFGKNDGRQIWVTWRRAADAASAVAFEILSKLVSKSIIQRTSLPEGEVRDAKAQRPYIKIVIGTGSPFEAIETAGLNRRCLVRVQVQNGTSTDISNGKLEIVNLDPPNAGVSNCLLKGDVVIGANAELFFDVAYYDMGSSQGRPAQFISLAVPAAAGYFAEASAYSRLPLAGHTLTLRFSRFSEICDEVFCSLELDGNRVLRLIDLIDRNI